MTVFEWISVIALVFGGVWALMQIHFNLKGQLENHKADTLNKAISDLGVIVSHLSKTITEVEEKFDSRVERLREEVNGLKIAMAENVAEIRHTRDSIGLMYNHFAGQKDKSPGTEVKQIGKDVFRVSDKKEKK